jgi:hypothetical protein
MAGLFVLIGFLSCRRLASLGAMSGYPKRG